MSVSVLLSGENVELPTLIKVTLRPLVLVTYLEENDLIIIFLSQVWFTAPNHKTLQFTSKKGEKYQLERQIVLETGELNNRFHKKRLWIKIRNLQPELSI